MPTTVALQGNKSGQNNGLNQRPGTSVLQLSTGAVVAVVVDTNRAGANPDYGTNDNVAKIEVFYSTDRVTFTRVANITPTSVIGPPFAYSADLFADNSVAIVWVGAAGIRYRKISFAAGAFTVGAEVAVASAPANSTFECIDASVSDSDTVLVAAGLQYSTGTTRQAYRLYGLRSGQTVWETVGPEYAMSTADDRNNAMAIGVSWAKGTLTTAKRAYMVIWGGTSVAADLGFSAWCDSTVENAALAASTRVQAFASVGVGGLTSAGGWLQQARAIGIAATLTDNQWLFGMVTAVGPDAWVGKVTFNGTTATPTVPITSLEDMEGYYITGATTCAVTVGKDAVNILVNNSARQDTVKKKVTFSPAQPINWVATIGDDTPSVIWRGRFFWHGTNSPSTATYMLYGGGGRNARSQVNFDAMFMRAPAAGISEGTVLTHEYAVRPTRPVSHTPAAGATLTTSTPILSLTADLDRAFPQAGHKAMWQFAQDAGFTSNVKTYRQGDNAWKTIKGTDVKGVTVVLTDTLPPLYELSQGTWYVRSYLLNQFNNQSAVKTATGTFRISHPPSAGSLKPSGEQLLNFNIGEVYYSWTFSDPSPTDYQTGFQIIVENNATGLEVYNSQKVASQSAAHVGTIPATSKDVVLRWKVRVWDKDNVPGPYSDYSTFIVSDPPVVVISSPTLNQVLATGIPTVTFTPTTVSDKKITRVRIVYTRRGQVVHSSGDLILPSPVSSGTPLGYTPDAPILDNDSRYTIQVYVTDERGLEGVSAPITVSTSFIVPPAPLGQAIATAGYNQENAGYVAVTWNDTNRDVDFQSWVVYRRDDMLDALGNVIAQGEKKIIGYVYEPQATYTFRDYFAPSGHKVNYLVTQLVNRFGDLVESSNTLYTSAVISSEGYWLIEPPVDGVSGGLIRLYNVTGDDFTDEYEEAEYTIIGRGRHIDRGDNLGKKGTLNAQIRDSLGTSARQRRLQLEAIKKKNTSLYLRNPFGDVWRVSVGTLQVTRIAGVGSSEFVDVSIPYSEVYE